MGKHSVYLRKEHEAQLRREAERVGLPLPTLLSRRIADASERLAQGGDSSFMAARIARLEQALDRILGLFEIVASDIAYVAGVTRTSTHANGTLVQAGREREEAVRRAMAALEDSLEKPSPATRGSFGGAL